MCKRYFSRFTSYSWPWEISGLDLFIFGQFASQKRFFLATFEVGQRFFYGHISVLHTVMPLVH
jgi:hypothetical protein